MAGLKLTKIIGRWWENLLLTFFWNKIKVFFYLEVISLLFIIALEVLGVIWLFNAILG